MRKEKIYLDNIKEVRDGFSWSELNCFYRAFAYGFYNFNSNYYNTFLLLILMYVNYVIQGERILTFNKNDLIFEFYKQEVKDIFNIGIDCISYTRKKSMKKNLKEHLSDNEIIIMPVDPYFLTYSKTYLELHKRHYIIIKGIDENKNIVYMLDNLHDELGASTRYSDFMLDIDILYKMNESFLNEFDGGGLNKYFWTLKKEVAENKDYHEKIKNYFNKVTDKIVKNNLDNPYEKNVLSYICDGGYNLLWYMEFINNKKTFFKLLQRYLLENFLDNSEKDSINTKIEDYLISKEKEKIYIATLFQKEKIFEKANNKVLESISRENEILTGFTNFISNNDLGSIFENKEISEYKIINNNNAMIKKNNNIYEIYLDSGKIYDIWNNKMDGVVIYKPVEKQDFEFKTIMEITTDLGESNHSGIYIEFEDGNKILFGSLGRLNMVVYKLDGTNDYECFIRNMVIEKNTYLEIDLKGESIYYKVDKDEIFKMDIKNKIKYVGVFVKNWREGKVKSRFEIL